MSDGGLEAPRRSGVAAKHRGVKPPGGAKRPDTKTVRLQLHLGAETAQRLGVHCSLVGRNQSRVADEILTAYLGRFGKGREIFQGDPDGEVDDETPVGSED